MSRYNTLINIDKRTIYEKMDCWNNIINPSCLGNLCSLFLYLRDAEKVKALISAVSAYAVSASLLLNAYSMFSQARERKLDQTFRVIEKWDDKHFTEARDHTRKHQNAQKGMGLDQIADEIERGINLKRSVIMTLNYFEYIENSIKHERINADIIMEHFADMIQDMLGRYEGYLKRMEDEGRNSRGIKNLRNLKRRSDEYMSKM